MLGCHKHGFPNRFNSAVCGQMVQCDGEVDMFGVLTYTFFHSFISFRKTFLYHARPVSRVPVAMIQFRVE